MEKFWEGDSEEIISKIRICCTLYMYLIVYSFVFDHVEVNNVLFLYV